MDGDLEEPVQVLPHVRRIGVQLVQFVVNHVPHVPSVSQFRRPLHDADGASGGLEDRADTGGSLLAGVVVIEADIDFAVLEEWDPVLFEGTGTRDSEYRPGFLYFLTQAFEGYSVPFSFAEIDGSSTGIVFESPYVQGESTRASNILAGDIRSKIDHGTPSVADRNNPARGCKSTIDCKAVIA